MVYPNSPGWKSPGPSKDAAVTITGHAKTVRDRVHLFLVEQYPRSFSADQIADALGENILTVRPRVSELHGKELIEPTAERRKNASGMSAQCWRASPNKKGEAA